MSAADAFRKVTPGESRAVFPAVLFNTMIDVCRAFKAGRLGGGAGAGGAFFPQTGIVKVKNASGGVVPRYGVLGVNGPLYDPGAAPDEFANRVTLIGVTPTSAYLGKFVITRQQLAANQVGDAYAAGVFAAKVNVGNASHTNADAGTTTTELVSTASGGAKILWKQTGTGAGKWALLLAPAGGGAAVDLLNDNVVAVAGANGISIPVFRGTDTIFEFVTNPDIPGGGDFQFRPQTGDFKVLQWQGGAGGGFVMDYVKSHA